jgi:hypothetical protein
MTDGVSEERIDDEVLDDRPDSAAEENPEEMEGAEPTAESITEAVLFASDEPLSAERLAGIVGAGSVKDIRKCIETLNEKYDGANSAFRIE